MSLKHTLQALKQTVTWELAIVTPHDAAKYLSRMTPNRRISMPTVFEYVGAMKEGDWNFTGECIIFNDKDELIDGQHRLRAIVDADVSIIMGIIRGIPWDTLPNLNTGRRRTANDVLTMKGHAYGTLKGAAARCHRDLHAIEEDTLSMASFNRRRISHQKILDFCDKFGPVLEEAVAMVAGREIWHSPALFCALYLRLAEIDRIKAQSFFRILLSGDPVPGGRVILALREKLDRVAPRQKRAPRFRAATFVPLVYRAWNTWLLGDRGPFDHLFNGRSWPDLLTPAEAASKKSKRSP